MSSLIYFVQRNDGCIKIGTSVNVWQRLNQLKRQYGKIIFLGAITGGRAKEKILHWCLNDSRVDGEWFQPSEQLLEIIGEHSIKPERSANKKKGAKSFLITLPENELKRLRDIALYHGYVLDRSQLKGQGSIRKMLIAIAEDELILYPRPQLNENAVTFIQEGL